MPVNSEFQSVDIGSCGEVAVSAGQGTMATSIPVAIASDQTTLNVSITGTNQVTQGTSPWVVSLTSTTITGTVAVTQSTSPWVANITQVASTTLGAPQTFGTAPTGVVIGTSSDIYVAGTRARSNQTTTAAGVVDVNVVGSLGATISATNPTFASISDGTTKVGVVALQASLKTDLTSVVGTATATATAGVQLVGIEGHAGGVFDAATAAAVPANALQVAGTDGANLRALSVDSSGNQRTINAGTSNTASAAWTSATALNTAVTLLSANFSYNTIIVTLNQTTTITGGVVTFEVSNDNATWVSSSGIDYVSDGNDVQTYTLQASTYKTLKFNIGGWQYFRVRLSTVITGTGTVTVGFAAHTNGVPTTKVQELKDSGRTIVVLYVDNVVAPAAEALQTININKGGATSTATSYTVTAGKTFRIQSMTLASQVNTGLGAVKARLRVAAAVLVTSPVYCTLFAAPSTTSGTSNVGNADQTFPDGLEIAGGQQVGISTISQANTGNATVCIVGYEY